MMGIKKEIVWVCLIALLAFSLRFVFLNLYTPTNLQSNKLEQHGLYAKNIYEGNGYTIHPDLPPTATRTPLYIFFVVGIWEVFGFSLDTPLIFQCILDSLSCIAIYIIGKMVFCAPAGILAAFLWAIYYPEYFYCLNMYAEQLLTLLLLLHVLFFIKALKNESLKYFILSGILLGLATMTRPVTQLYVVGIPLVLFLFYGKGQVGKIFHHSFMIIIAFGIIVMPWVVRNYLLFNKVIVGTTVHAPVSVYIANELLDMDESSERVKKIYLEAMDNKYLDMPIHKDLSEIELDQIFKDEVVKFVINEPVKFIKNSFGRFSLLMFNYHAWSKHRKTVLVWKDWLFILANTVFLLSTLLAYIKFKGDWHKYSYPIIVLVVYNILIHSLVRGAPRYNLQIIPYFIIFFSYSILQLFLHNLILSFSYRLKP